MDWADLASVTACSLPAWRMLLFQVQASHKRAVHHTPFAPLSAVLPFCFGARVQMIDEVHTLIGAGAAEGAIDAANILKPALARGELQCIGATTLDEYRKHIEKDPALER